MKHRVETSLFLSFIVVLAAGCAGLHKKKALPSARPHLPIVGMEKVDRDVIESMGLGAPDRTLKTQDKMRESAYNKALVMARQELENIVSGFEIPGRGLLRSAMAGDSALGRRLDKALNLAKVVKTDWTRDDGCVLRLQIRKSKLQKKLKVTFR